MLCIQMQNGQLSSEKSFNHYRFDRTFFIQQDLPTNGFVSGSSSWENSCLNLFQIVRSHLWKYHQEFCWCWISLNGLYYTDQWSNTLERNSFRFMPETRVIVPRYKSCMTAVLYILNNRIRCTWIAGIEITYFTLLNIFYHL